jgi:uncharacterized protein (DUF885 family)
MQSTPGSPHAPEDLIGETTARLHSLLDNHFDSHLQLHPLQATFAGEHRYDDRLANDLSPEHRAQVLLLERDCLRAALRLDPVFLSAEDWLSWEMFVRERRAAIAAAEFPTEWLPINQLLSLPLLLPLLASGTSAQSFDCGDDYQRFLGRLEGFVAWCEQAIVNMRIGLARGVTQPRSLMLQVQLQLAEVLNAELRSSPFYLPLTNFPPDCMLKQRRALEKAFRKTLRTAVLPSYRRLHDFIRDEYLPHTRASVAWSDLPDGAAWYAFLVRQYTDGDDSSEAICEKGLSEVARLRQQIEELKERLGFQGDVPQLFRWLQHDPRFYHEDPAALLAGYRELQVHIAGRLPELFAECPRAHYEIRPIESFRAHASAGAFYQAAAPDGRRPGIFYVNTCNLKTQPKFGMETLFLHEAAPGHHFQIALQQESRHLPRFRRFSNRYVAFTEGWALYAESIGPELGMCQDPFQHYGRLNDEMLRAMRLVVDTGLHTRGWTREQASRYMLANSSMTPAEAQAEVERYIADPAQALSYKMGQLCISDLRRQAEAAFGRSFDVREFHHRILRNGAMPLDLLEATVQHWMHSAREPQQRAIAV